MMLAGLAAMCRQQAGGTIGGYARGRWCRAEDHFNGTLWLLGHSFQVTVVLLNLLFALLLVLYRNALWLDSICEAKKVAKQCSDKEKTNQNPTHNSLFIVGKGMKKTPYHCNMEESFVII